MTAVFDTGGVLAPWVLFAARALVVVVLEAVFVLGFGVDFQWQPLASSLCIVAALSAAASWPGGRRLRHLLSFAFLYVVFAECLAMLSAYLDGPRLSEAFFYHLSPNSLIYANVYVLETVLLSGVLAGCVAMELVLSKRAYPVPRHVVAGVVAVSMLGVAALEPSPAIVVARHVLEDGGGRSLATGDDYAALERAGVRADRLFWRAPRPSQAEPPNLVQIFMESVERNYFDETRFPGLTPNLKSLAAQGVEFPHMRQENFARFTAGGMFASQCGVPVTMIRQGKPGNDILNFNSTRRVLCVGDVLETLGYRQVFMQGADLSFAGTGKIFEDHGYAEVLGRDALSKASTQPRNKWGLYDDDVFSQALGKIREMSAQPAPFSVTIATMDTHHPGSPSPSCPAYPHDPDPIVQAVHCTDHLVGKMVRDVRALELERPTRFVIMSDHLSMAKFKDEDRSGRMLIYFSLGSPEPRRIETAVTQYDIPYLLLYELGVEGDFYFPFGRDLLRHPESAGATTAPLDKELVASLARVYAALTVTRFECGDRVVVEQREGFVSVAEDAFHFSHANGRRGWPAHYVAAFVLRDDGGLVHHDFIPSSQVAYELAPFPGRRVLLIGDFRRLAEIKSPRPRWGYYFGVIGDAPVTATRFASRTDSNFVLACPGG